MKENYFRHYGQTLQEQARDLRKNMTGPERKLWFCFLKGLSPKFSCQKIIGPYIVDFFCAAYDLAIEIDGESHTETVTHDQVRANIYLSTIYKFCISPTTTFFVVSKLSAKPSF